MREQPSSTQYEPIKIHLILKGLSFLYKLAKGLTWTLVVGALLSGLMLLYLKSRPLPVPNFFAPSMLYDDQGQVFGRLDDGEARIPVRLADLPPSLIAATLAAEDKDFYRHHGFSIKGILRAVAVNVREGQIEQGASTITQQLARNLYLTHDRTWSRKIKEALLTVQLELHYTKNQILELYLNQIYYGHGAYGVGRAAKLYFNKKAEDLTLAESAFLAGIPRGPSHYSPWHHLDRARKRQHHILDLMAKNGKITSAEAQQAKQSALALAPQTRPKQLKANYFRDYVISTLVNRYGLDEAMVRRGGLKIYTTLNTSMQRAAEQAVKQYTGPTPELQGALISVDPRTGSIKAMVGGKDYLTSQYNRVFAKRQPGSSFKPFLYLSALQHGFTPITRIESKPTTFVYQGGTYKPANYRDQYAYRPITMREAIARSDNIYAVSTLLAIGMDREISLAHQLGIKSPLKATPSLALGSYTVSPYEMAEAYATIASAGVRHPLVGITKVVDPFNRIIVQEQNQPQRVASPAHAFVLTKLMSSVLEPGGTGYRVRQQFTRPAAGKTGTTDWDGWIAGYTPDLVTITWVGYDQGKRLPHHQARLSQTIWAHYMKEATKGQPVNDFPVPAGVKGVYIDEETGKLATPLCDRVRFEYFVSGTEPKEIAPQHRMPEKDPTLWEQLVDWWSRL
ncbi:transglycosylase domain-containing protein [Laceyella putida]|uniref:Transglycosylase domain-containing protein n=1 Tax=Laceyella putida TaxID=110101 RepID=A0ABW2RGQ2_9BACL